MSDTYRSVGLQRTGPGEFVATNARGGTIRMGGDDADFTPVELFLASLAGCAAVTVEEITARRAVPERFEMTAEGHKRRDEDGAHMTDLRLLFDVLFPEGEAGDAARAVLGRTIAQTRDRLCTVSGTVHRGTPVEYVERD